MVAFLHDVRPSFVLDDRIVPAVNAVWTCPKIKPEFLRALSHEILWYSSSGELEDEADLDSHVRWMLDDMVGGSLEEMTIPGTGLPTNIQSDRAFAVIEGPVILEVKSVTDLGVSAFTLEKVRIERDGIHYSEMLSLARAGKCKWLTKFREELPAYPRKCLEFTLTDGHTNLRAVELERLLGFNLGSISPGLKIRLKNFPVIEGVAYIQNRNIERVGGLHDRDDVLAENLRIRMYRELHDAKKAGVSAFDLFSLNIPEKKTHDTS
ncbi:hypothetical protein NMY22_g10770 [Coprinellus aureogranulatus]|nr:hypothetical protein NMY22_g10770 [Coprinellus aureogranulatus]